LIKTANIFSKQTRDFDLHVVEAFDEIMTPILDNHLNVVNAFQQPEEPT
jgi:hypothetical protein